MTNLISLINLIPLANIEVRTQQLSTMSGDLGINRRILLFPLPYQGHINPMLELASLLHLRGFSITIFHTQFNSIDPTKHPSYDFISIIDGTTSNHFEVNNFPSRFVEHNNNCEQPFYDSLRKYLSENKGVTCLVADLHWYKIHAVAKRLGVVSLVLRTGSAASLRWFTSFPVLRAKGYYPLRESEKDELVTELPPYRVKDLIPMDKCRIDDFAMLVERDIEAAKNSSGIIINTFTAIESDEIQKLHQELSVPIFSIGPLHKFTSQFQSSLLPQDRSCLDWLDKQAPGSVLYVSFGSLASLNYEEFVETAWGLANSRQPFLWVVRPGSVCGTENVSMPDGFDEEIRGRGMVVAWAPQLEVLAHDAVGGFWTHNGWNSTLEGIWEGVPMICRPFFADQMGNARYVTHVWKVGIELEGKLERRIIEKTVRSLMKEKEGDEIRERMRVLRKNASECTKADGSSHLAINKLVNHILSL
ncbi:UDP-Glycosyltransferase superfamily protein [Rhynchospora pubera]|uniref:2,4-dihydroxy-7-methoxy-2H-1,4-benzoxazin-3(4H)-one 2-D-glucosyltransferase n=1 Tax=Rhynchospora pubera TaxID=906938 RepID=A0AAV8HNS1_9POAL|nr:UDP-Glycosyltransferase superfamily protein [Rhynchospora pubera]KAJ4816438.1 UDP-Glycosyltransferase superfamily protein [Rhynchospora pubera]